MPTLADGLAVPKVGPSAFATAKGNVDRTLLVRYVVNWLLNSNFLWYEKCDDSVLLEWYQVLDILLNFYVYDTAWQCRLNVLIKN